MKVNKPLHKAYLLKEDFQNFWEYSYPGCAGRFLDAWCFRAMRSKKILGGSS